MPRRVPANRLRDTLHCATRALSPRSANSRSQYARAKNPRSSSRGSRSIWNAPRILVSAKIIVRLAFPSSRHVTDSDNDRRWNGHDESTSAPTKLALLLEYFLREVPRQEQYMTRLRLEEVLGGKDRQMRSRRVSALLHG